MLERSLPLESTIISQDRIPAGSGRVQKSSDNGHIPHRLASRVREQSGETSLVSGTERGAHKLSRAIDGISSAVAFCAIPQGSPCSGQDGQDNGDNICKSAGWQALAQELARKLIWGSAYLLSLRVTHVLGFMNSGGSPLYGKWSLGLVECRCSRLTSEGH